MINDLGDWLKHRLKKGVQEQSSAAQAILDHCELSTVINRHLKQLTRRLSSNHNNNKNSHRKGGSSSITLLHVAHNFLPIKILMTE